MTQRGKEPVQKPDSSYLTNHTPPRKWCSASQQGGLSVAAAADHMSCASDPHPPASHWLAVEFELEAAQVSDELTLLPSLWSFLKLTSAVKVFVSLRNNTEFLSFELR